MMIVIVRSVIGRTELSLNLRIVGKGKQLSSVTIKGDNVKEDLSVLVNILLKGPKMTICIVHKMVLTGMVDHVGLLKQRETSEKLDTFNSMCSPGFCQKQG